MRTRTHSYGRTTSFARLLLVEWRKLKLPVSDEMIVAGVSGGADSTALLLALDELREAKKVDLKICVAHLDHQIRKGSAKDARWVAALSKRLGYKPVIGHARVADIARASSGNLEQTARLARYKFFERTASRLGARFVLTAHTMDDQAETVLLRLMRGSAAGGLGGIEPLRTLAMNSGIILVRPLLWARHADTVSYCHERKTEFLADEMNDDERFARVKVRKQLLPLMQSFNNRIVDALSRTATLLREDNDVLLAGAQALLTKASDLEETSAPSNVETKGPPLNVRVLSSAPAALRRRALLQWVSTARGNARRLEMVHLLAVEKLLQGSQGGRVVELPDGARVRRRGSRLEFDAKNR